MCRRIRASVALGRDGTRLDRHGAAPTPHGGNDRGKPCEYLLASLRQTFGFRHPSLHRTPATASAVWWIADSSRSG